MDNENKKVNYEIYKPWRNRILPIYIYHDQDEETIKNDAIKYLKHRVFLYACFVLFFLLVSIISSVLGIHLDISSWWMILLSHIFWLPTIVLFALYFFMKNKNINRINQIKTLGVRVVEVLFVSKEIFNPGGDEHTAYFFHFSDGSICRIEEKWYNDLESININNKFKLVYTKGDEPLPIICYI